MESLITILPLVAAVCSPLAAAATIISERANTSAAFTYNSTNFFLHGEPLQIMGGQIDPQRIPYQYWADRLAKVRAMGINTIFTYVFWDQMMPEPNTWTAATNPQNNIAEWFRLAQEAGLHAVLRPGPYACGEHEWGAFPPWLSEVDGMVVRSNNKPFLNAAESYFQHLAEDLKPLMISNGGPILMVQVENEYGSYGDDHTYTGALKSMLKKYFPGAMLYTNDGPTQDDLQGGSIPGVLAEIDGSPQGFDSRNQYITDPSKLGPLLDGEYYTLWPDQWSSSYTHQFPSDSNVQTFVDDIDYALGERKASMSLYMVHGGTNFGFQNGALYYGKTMAWTTSYDYGAPIDESGRKQFYYDTMRNTISKYFPNDNIPEPADDIPLMHLPQLTLKPVATLWDPSHNTRSANASASPKPMEAYGQAYGFILYSYIAEAAFSGVITVGDRARDRALVYVNGVRTGVIDSQYEHPPLVNVTLKHGDELAILVENAGRVNYYSRTSGEPNMLLEPHKGIVGNVTIGSQVLSGWKTSSFPVPNGLSRERSSTYGPMEDKRKKTNTSIPTFYRGHFKVPRTVNAANGAMGMDTFLAVPNGVRGEVWVNGFHLGRYWLVGPQQSLYLPGTLLKAHGRNEIVVLELEPSQMANQSMIVEGLTTREWFNQPDPDCNGCT